jgi:hypothetical protein
MARPIAPEVVQQHKELWGMLGLTYEGLWSDPRIKVWRSLPDRENCVLEGPEGLRLHIKRYRKPRLLHEELEGYRLLVSAGIPTGSLMASAALPDGRSAIVWLENRGFRPADRVLEDERGFDTLLEPTAAIAGRLHRSGLHHRDLYLNHFVLDPADPSGMILIDSTRVRRLPLLFPGRWITKDLAQFVYSTRRFGVTSGQVERWLDAWESASGLRANRAAIARKVNWIAAHDRHLNQRQPHRNRPVPGS